MNVKLKNNSSAKSDVPLAESEMRLSKVLVPIDFSPESRNALLYARALSRQFGASLTLLHVVEPIVCQADFGYGLVRQEHPNQEVLNKMSARLNRLRKRVADVQHVPVACVRSGMADDEIVRAAQDLQIDLIVMGTHGDSRKPTSISSAAEALVRHSPCPVFIVRKKEHEFAWRRKSKKVIMKANVQLPGGQQASPLGVVRRKTHRSSQETDTFCQFVNSQ